MSKFKIRSTTVLAIALCLSAASFAQNHPFISFDAPDGANGTFPAKINASGQIVGGYSDSNRTTHSFVRSVSGQITEFDPPNLTTSQAFDINSRGQIVGQGQDAHAYLRLANGTFREIDPPGVVSLRPSESMTRVPSPDDIPTPATSGTASSSTQAALTLYSTRPMPEL